MRILVVGGGTAGLAAAVSLARQNIDVIVLEAGEHCGAQTTAGRLINPGLLTEDEQRRKQLNREAPIKREIIRRDHLFYDGRGLTTVSQSVTDDIQYSVDHASLNRWLSKRVRDLGGTILTETTVTSLIRRQNHVTGVNTTQGTFYGDAVFIAEGGSAELVGREGLERRPPSTSPDFNVLITEKIEIGPHQLNDFFDLEADDFGVRQQIHVDRTVFPSLPKAFTAFLYTTRAGLVLGVSAPVEALKASFDGSPYDLLAWLKKRPFISPLVSDNESTGIQATVERRPTNPVPRLANHGLAVGGMATGLGYQPPPDHHANVSVISGRLFAEACGTLRQRDQSFKRENLRKQYVDPLLDRLGDSKSTPVEAEEQSSAVGLLNGSLRAWGKKRNELHRLYPRYGVRSPLGAIKRIFNGLPILPSWSSLMEQINLSLLCTWIGHSLGESNESGRDVGVTIETYRPGDDGNGKRRNVAELPKLSSSLEPWLRSICRNHGETDSASTQIRSFLRPWSLVQLGQFLVSSLTYVLTHPFHVLYNSNEAEGDPTERLFAGPVPSRDPKLDHVDIYPGTPSSFVSYGRGFMENDGMDLTPGHSTCPTGVFHEKISQNDPDNPTLDFNRCIRCGACLAVAKDLEWSALTPGRVTYAPETEQKPSPDRQPTDPGKFTGSETSLDAGHSLLSERLRRIREQARLWIRIFEDQTGPLDPDGVRWLMTLIRTIKTTTETLNDELTGLEPPEPIVDLSTDLIEQLDKAQQQVASRHLIHAHGTVRQILDHHLQQLDRSIGVAGKFEYPYGMYYRLEQSRRSGPRRNHDDQSPKKESQSRSHQFVLETINHFPYPEIFGQTLPFREQLRDVCSSLLSDDVAVSQSQVTFLEQLGQLSHDDNKLGRFLELTEDEEVLWKEAGHYNVMTDVVERWRQWQREYPQFGSPDTESHQTPRGKLVVKLWAARETLNRVHARMMTGLDAEVELAKLRQFMARIQRFKHQQQVILRNSDALVDLAIERPAESGDHLEPGDIDRTDAASSPPAIINPIHYLNAVRSSRDREQNGSVTNRLDWAKSVNNWLWKRVNDRNQAPPPATANHQRGRMALDALTIDSLRWLIETASSPFNDEQTCLTNLMVILSAKSLAPVVNDAEDTPVGTFNPANARGLMRKSQSSVLDYLVTFLQEKFRDHEAPELPDEHLEPSYDLVRERIVHTVDQFGDKLKTCRGDRRPFFRLAEMLAHYLAILSVYTRRNRYRSDNHPAKEMFEDVAPLVRRLHHNKLNLLDEELSRVSEGAEHRVTPPEILISKRAQNTADTKG